MSLLTEGTNSCQELVADGTALVEDSQEATIESVAKALDESRKKNPGIRIKARMDFLKTGSILIL